MYRFFIDSPSILFIFSNKKTGLRKFQLWIYLRYAINGRLYLNQKKQISKYFGISVGHLNRLINSLNQAGLLEKQNSYFDAVGKVRFGERFAYLGTKAFAISEEEIKDVKKFRTWIYTVQGEQYATKYGQKLDQTTGEITQHVRKESRLRKELTDNKNEKDIEQSMSFKRPFQDQSATYLSKCLHVSAATANRHTTRAKANNYIEVQKNLEFAKFKTDDGVVRQYAGTKEDAIGFLKYLQNECNAYQRHFVCKANDGNGYGSGKYYGIACLRASTLTYHIEYKRTGLKYSQIQMDELENNRILQHYKNK